MDSALIHGAFNKTLFPLLLAQYKLSDKGPGQERDFHWALFIITDTTTLTGSRFEIIPRLTQHPDGRARPVWRMNWRLVALDASTLCLGAVKVGAVPAPSYAAVVELIRSHKPIMKSQDWGPRDWVTEVLGLLRAQGFINENVLRPGVRVMTCLWPDLIRVSKATVEDNPVDEKGQLVHPPHKPAVKWDPW